MNKLNKNIWFLFLTTIIALTTLGMFQACSVNSFTIKLKSIAVTPDSTSVPVGATKQFTATGTYSDDTTKDLTASVSWSSSNIATATIDSAGNATPLAAGTATITAESDGVSGTSTLTVTNSALLSIAVTPASPSTPKGMTVQFTAVGTYADNSTQDLTTQVAWNSSDSSVTIDAAGLATTTTAGTGISITATKTPLSGTPVVSNAATLTVRDVTLVSIAVTSTASSTPAGTNVQFTATGTFSDSTTLDLTAQVTWSSDNTAAATVSSTKPGLIRAVAAGAANISATAGASLGSVTNSTLLTVTAPVFHGC